MSQSDPSVPWPQVEKFIGQLNHDLRNHLNAIELQSAFLAEIVGTDEARNEIKRLREMTAEMNAQLQRLSGQIAEIQPHTMRYDAADLVEDLRTRVKAKHPESADAIDWQVSLGKEELEIDPQLLLEAFGELIENALTHERGEGPLVFRADSNGAFVTFTLREPKKNAPALRDDWGARPFAQMRHGHYALGLFRARGIFAAHDGTFQASFDPASAALISVVRLPRAKN
jgi:K+-sensing histidine kinase KdpD